VIPRTIPIQQVKPNLNDSVRMAVAEIERFLGLFYPAEAIQQTDAGKAVAGQWLSRIKGFHNDDDFLHLTRDFLSYVLSGGERSQVADQLGWYFGGFMPSYGAACTLMKMAAQGQPWSELQAFMHSQSYGDARQYVESFDWGSAKTKAQSEIKAWADIVQAQDKALQEAAWGEPVLLAQANPMPAPPGGPVTDVPANDPRMPRPKPKLRLVPPPLPPASAQAAEKSLLRYLLRYPWLIVLVPLMIPGDTPRRPPAPAPAVPRADPQGGASPQPAPQDAPTQIVVPLDESKPLADTDTTNNRCKAQKEENQKNGAECENDGYVLMEQALLYKRLVDPPKGRGLDGLFEKHEPGDQPNPMPVQVTQPKPGKLVFIPPDAKPPQTRYDFAGKPPQSTYPKFVVFEAKNIAKGFDEKDTEGIKDETKNRLKNTCDGQQLGLTWTEKRIPQALERQYPRAGNSAFRNAKEKEITNAGYARWIFVCLPGPVGSNTKLYVLIDVVASGMDLESMTPKPRKGSTTPEGNTY